MSEIGRAGWFTFGATAMAVAGVGHAVAGLGHIAREMTRARPAGDRRASSPGGPDLLAVSGAGSWILFSALILAGGAAYQAIAGTREIIKEIVHAAPVP